MIDWTKKITKAEKDELAAIRLAAKERRNAIEAEKESQGLQEVTVEQAYQYIDNQMDSITNLADAKVVLARVLKRMVPYILEDK